MPVVVDQITREEPEASFLSLSYETGYTSISFGQYANAINGVAWWLEHHIGKGDHREALAYVGIGGADIYSAILLIAAHKAGYYVGSISHSICSNLQPADFGSDAVQLTTE